MEAIELHRYDEEFLAGIAKKQLLIAVNQKTGAALDYHWRGWCAQQDPNVRWLRASGKGELLSYTVTRRAYSPDFPVPLVHGLVELEEGPRLICRIETDAPESVQVGMTLKATFDNKGLIFRTARSRAVHIAGRRTGRTTVNQSKTTTA
ncbi:MAG: OB-fold domain-containing protein [Hydrogenophaga sp.]|jgi:uncharacterized OB-fold protein|uniref:Zn-ribbon domain-containing OB-fold protein n=1 Tax=Hydrogenophaga sp. TaxID=1904254 RepID=UPI0026041AC8|nr:OB-fold domain-containing protein [Hydrogenophaga sp.]MCW5670745.1 OB-fold domain-containing protein [Hydrogenophaga sp.]